MKNKTLLSTLTLFLLLQIRPVKANDFLWEFITSPIFPYTLCAGLVGIVKIGEKILAKMQKQLNDNHDATMKTVEKVRKKRLNKTSKNQEESRGHYKKQKAGNKARDKKLTEMQTLPIIILDATETTQKNFQKLSNESDQKASEALAQIKENEEDSKHTISEELKKLTNSHLQRINQNEKELDTFQTNFNKQLKINLEKSQLAHATHQKEELENTQTFELLKSQVNNLGDTVIQINQQAKEWDKEFQEKLSKIGIMLRQKEKREQPISNLPQQYSAYQQRKEKGYKITRMLFTQNKSDHPKLLLNN